MATLLAIRRFEEERKAWETEKEELEERRCNQEKQLAALARQIELLQAQGPPPAPAPQALQVSGDLSAHHKRQCALMTTIDTLGSDLKQEQNRVRELEDKLAVTTAALHGGSVTPRQAAAPPDTPRGNQIVEGDLLDATVRSVQTRQKEVRSLEDENLSLREELNKVKEKYIGLKRAQNERNTAWRQELETIAQELEEKERLEEHFKTLKQDQSRLQQDLVKSAEREVTQSREVMRLKTELAKVGSSAGLQNACFTPRSPRPQTAGYPAGPQEQSRMQQELAKATEREAKQAQEIMRLRAELEQAYNGAQRDERSAGAPGMPPEEMQQLNIGLGQQLVKVEQELKEQVRKSSRLLEHFLSRAQGPLEVLRRFSRHAAASSPNVSMEAPPKFEPNVHDLPSSLNHVLQLLKFAAQIVEAREATKRRSLAAP